jgi:Na+-translocating ferredoxin:NAD+ oxidoreductase subunit G
MTLIREPSAPAMAVRTAAVLFIFVVVFTGLLAAAYQSTRPAIERTQVEEKLRLIGEVLSPSLYDNDLLKDTHKLGATAELGLDDASLVYRARKGGQPAALVLESVAPDGYSGKIRLLVAFSADKPPAVLGVRVVGHKETPGLGDYIEPRKDQEARRNKARPWIEQFNNQSFATIGEREWKVKKDGGRFSAHAGATVTPRAVVKAVGKALKYVEANHVQLFAQEARQP